MEAVEGEVDGLMAFLGREKQGMGITFEMSMKNIFNKIKNYEKKENDL